MLQNIPLLKIKRPQLKARTKVEETKIEELANSIKEVGLINPILVKKVDDGYEIIAGERRYLAFVLLNEIEIPCVLFEDGRANPEELKLAENIMREDLNPIELARAALKVQMEFNLNTAKIARSLGKSKRWLEKKLSLLNLPTEIQEAIEKRLIVERVGVELGKVEEDIERERLLTFAVAHGATWKVVSDWVTSYLLGRSAKEKAVEQGLSTREPGEQKEVLVTCILCGIKDNILKMQYEPVHPECKAELFYKIKVLDKEKQKEG